MKTRQALPYLAALLLLAWILGSLARTGTSGGSILANSYWLVYIAYFLPVFAMVAMVALTVYLAVNWRLFSDAMGFGLAARRRAAKKKSNTIRLAVFLLFWALAIGTLFWRCGGKGIICQPDNSTQTLPATVAEIVGQGPGPTLPSLAGLTGPVHAMADLVVSPWFSLTFLGLLIISTVILARSILVSFNETKSLRLLPASVREEGSIAVQDALRVLEMAEAADPRTRIMACYERMIRAAAGLGADVGVDHTARELEKGIREMFRLRGRGIAELTRLFEEARYSLHDITETDSHQAQLCLTDIAEELKATVSVAN